jgi:DNA topoisomerase-3
LGLSPTGKFVEIPLPRGNEQDHSRPGERKKTESRKQPRTTANKTTEQSGQLGVCPLCKSEVIESVKSYSCSRWRDGCGLTIWKTMSGKKISAAMVKKLLRVGETSTLKGFKSKAGKKFDAKLKLVDGKVEFVFGSD